MNQKIISLVLTSALLAVLASPPSGSNSVSTRGAVLWFLPGAQSSPYWSDPEMFADAYERFRDTGFYKVLNEECSVLFLTDENATETIETLDFDLIVLVDAMAGWTMNHLLIDAFNRGKPILAINTEIFDLNFTFAYCFYPIKTNIAVTEQHQIVENMPDVVFRISDPTDLMCVVMCEVCSGMKVVASYTTPTNKSDPMIVVYQPVVDRKAVIVLCDWRSGNNPLEDEGLMGTFVDNVVNWLTLHEVDINGDGTVNILDIGIVAKAYGSCPEHPRWNQTADLNHDGVINIQDVALVCKDFGRTY